MTIYFYMISRELMKKVLMLNLSLRKVILKDTLYNALNVLSYK